MPTFDRWRRARALSWLFAVLAALLVCSQAEAQGSRPRAEEQWYGWQNLAIDGAAIALVSTSLALDATDALELGTNAWLYVFSSTVFALGSPIFDWAHGNVGLGFASLGLRLVSGVLMLLGRLAHALGCEVEDEESRPCGAGAGYYAGGVVFGVAPIAIDGALDYEPVSTASASLPFGLVPHGDGALLTFRGTL